jgi:hypothetical protein
MKARDQGFAGRAVQRESRKAQTVALRVQVHEHVFAVGPPVRMMASLRPTLRRHGDAHVAAVRIHRDHVLGAVAPLALPRQQAARQPAQSQHQARALRIPFDVEAEKVAALAGGRERRNDTLDNLRERHQQP